MTVTVRFRRVVWSSSWLALIWGVTTLVGAEEDIRDIRGPKATEQSWTLIALAGVVVLAVCVGYALWRRRGTGPRLRNPSLLEQTLEQLEGTRAVMQPTTGREFGIAASEVIRNYIEKRFGVIATQRTTEEFLQSLLQSSNETLAQRRSLLDDFLHQCDFVKFAGVALALADLEELFESARDFVVQTAEAPLSS
jgi:hypothetical protein